MMLAQQGKEFWVIGTFVVSFPPFAGLERQESAGQANKDLMTGTIRYIGRYNLARNL